MKARVPVALVLASLACAAIGAPATIVAADESPSPRVFRLERWLKDVLDHTPGQDDRAAAEVRSWSSPDSETLRVDEGVLMQLMHDPRQQTFLVSTTALPGTPAVKSRNVISYSSRELHRLQVLSCVATGKAQTSSLCADQFHALEELDAALHRLNEVVSDSTVRGDPNFVLRRGALLHTDAEIYGGGFVDAPQDSKGSLIVQGKDGQQTDTGFSGANWEAAEALMDGVRPAPDPIARLWYRATAAWMQREHRYLASHVDHASEAFPASADILFLSGTQHEIYGSPMIQAMVTSAVLPSGHELEAKSDRTELGAAETYFRRAVAKAPAMAEAHLHLGHVLLLRGKPDEAMRELRQALTTLDDPLLRYFGEMFLGASLEGAKQPAAARAAYTRALELFPRSQSAALALSAAAMRQGDRAAAMAAMDRMIAASGDEANERDPWWRYLDSQVRNADALLAEMYAPFRRTP